MQSIEFKFVDNRAYGNMGGHAEGDLIINMPEAVSGPKVYIKAMGHKFMVNCSNLKAGTNTVPFRFSVPITTGGCCMRMVLPGQYEVQAIVEIEGKRVATTAVYFNVEAQNYPMFGAGVVMGGAARSN
jgi:hypothetical protein